MSAGIVGLSGFLLNILTLFLLGRAADAGAAGAPESPLFGGKSPPQVF